MGLEEIVPAIFLIAVLILVLPEFLRSNSKSKIFFKNSLIWIVIIATVLMVFIDSGSIAFEVEDKWVDLLQLVLITVIGAYFGGRSIEKVRKNNGN